MRDLLDIDAAGRTAGADIVAATRAVATPPWTPPARRRPTMAIAVALAVVAVVAVTVVVDDRQPVEVGPRQAPGVLPRLALVGDGIEPLGASELPALDPGTSSSTTWIGVYGDPAAADPFAIADLRVVAQSIPTAAGLGIEGGLVVSADGSERTLTVPLPDSLVELTSRSLTEEELVAIGDGLEATVAADGVDVSLPSLPAGLAPVAVVPRAWRVHGIVAARSTSPATVATWRVDGSLVTVYTVVGDDDAVLVGRYALGAGATTVEADGRTGWRARDGRTVQWLIDGALVVVVGAAELAASIEPVDDRTWTELVGIATARDAAADRALAAVDVPGGAASIATGHADGSGWVVYRGGLEGVCAVVVDADGTPSDPPACTGSAAQDGDGWIVAGLAGGAVVFGAVGDDVASVAVDLATGTVGGDRGSLNQGMFAVDVAGLLTDGSPVTVRGFDLQGREIARATT